MHRHAGVEEGGLMGAAEIVKAQSLEPELARVLNDLLGDGARRTRPGKVNLTVG